LILKPFDRLTTKLFKSCDIASIVFFRISFGLIMLLEVLRYFYYQSIEDYFIIPEFHFTYYGFEWIAPWKGIGMYTHFIALGISAFFLLIGFFYHFAATLFFLGFTYIFLLDQALYLNHFYLICLLSFLMIFIPAHRSFSIDSWRNSKLYSPYIPIWALWMLRFQIGIPYFFGGIAKLNRDWLKGEPIRMWLADLAPDYVLGSYFTEEWVVYFLTYGGLIFDLFVIPCLLWKKTRLLAFLTTIFFNLTNLWLFNIGVFPWLMVAGTTLFFDSNWPRKMLWASQIPPIEPAYPKTLNVSQKLGLTCLGVYICLQIFMPLRHFLYPGNVAWTEQGHLFSWHMKLRDKEGWGQFLVYRRETEETYLIFPQEWLTPRQYYTMATRPDMIIQFAHFLNSHLKNSPQDSLEVYADFYVSLNGRDFQRIIEPTADLTQEERSLMPVSWIHPLDSQSVAGSRFKEN
jgi:vitamin K-dependent gamma-carboxylase